MSREKKEIVFAKGFYFKKREKSPNFVVGALDLKSEDAIKFIQDNTNNRGYCNLQILESRSGGYYIELDTFKPESSKRDTAATRLRQERDTDDLPF